MNDLQKWIKPHLESTSRGFQKMMKPTPEKVPVMEFVHIDDWLDDPQAVAPQGVKEWFEEFRKPAMSKNREMLDGAVLTCTYKDGKRYRCIGCSRLGDVWLTSKLDTLYGYELRISITSCSDWKIERSS